MNTKIIIELTPDEASELLTELYQGNFEYQDSSLGKLYKELYEVIG